MKKLLKILLLTVLSVSFAIGMAGCKNNGGKETEKGVLCTKIDGNYVLYGYVDDGSNLKTLDLGEAVKAKYNADLYRIKKGAFSGNNLLETVIVPSSVCEIDGGAFENMKKLSSLTLPFVGGNVNADAYLNQTPASENKAVDAERTFGYIFGTTEYTGGTKITLFADDNNPASYYMPMTLRTVKIAPKEDYEIPMYAFDGMTMLNTLYLTNKVKGIGEGAFKNFTSLQSLNFDGTSAEWDEVVKYTDWDKGVAEGFSVKTQDPT